MKYLSLCVLIVCTVGCGSSDSGATPANSATSQATPPPMANNPDVPDATKKALNNAFSTRGNPPPANASGGN